MVVWCYGWSADSWSRNEAEIASVYAAGEEDVDIAVKAAKKALKDPSWKDLPPTDRGQLMIKLADLIEQHKETLATIETWDNGEYISWHAGKKQAIRILT